MSDLKIHLPETDIGKILDAEFAKIGPDKLGVARQIIMALRISNVGLDLATLLENMITSSARQDSEHARCKHAFQDVDPIAYEDYVRDRIERIKANNAADAEAARQIN